MKTIRKTMQEELREIALGIADGLSVLDIAAKIGVDRSTLSAWTKRYDFLAEVAAALSSPDELGSDRLAQLMSGTTRAGERAAAHCLRLAFRDALLAAHEAYFDRRKTAAERNAECVAGDQQYVIPALVELEERSWARGTSDERSRGLNTAQKRRAYRLRHGLKWDWGGLGCYFPPRWTAKRCAIRYAYEDGRDDDEVRKLYGASEFEADEHDTNEVVETNTRPLEVRRDKRLPVTVAAAARFYEAVVHGADFQEAVAAAANGVGKVKGRKS